LSVNRISRTVSPIDLKFDKCLATGTSKCSEFDIVWIRNAKDISKYTVSVIDSILTLERFVV